LGLRKRDRTFLERIRKIIMLREREGEREGERERCVKKVQLLGIVYEIK